jgi:hypothetical protein
MLEYINDTRSHECKKKNKKIMRVLENRVLRNILGPTREEVTGYWWRLYNEKLHYLCLSLNIPGVITSRRIT